MTDPLDNRLVECGGELYLAVDFTPAGFPIGLRVERLENSDLRFLDDDLEDFTLDDDQSLRLPTPASGRRH